MKPAKDLTCSEIVELVESLQSLLYLDLDDEGRDCWNADKSWSGDEFDSIARLLRQYDLVPNAELASPTTASEPCECQLPGFFCSGIPGILAKVENCRVVAGGEIQRCDLCQRYPSDQAARDKLAELGMA